MSEPNESLPSSWINESIVWTVRKRLENIKFADRVQMIHKLLKLIFETLDGMEAEAKKECP